MDALPEDFWPPISKKNDIIIFRDPVYATAPLTRNEVELISHNLVLRLSGVRQNGLLEYVYPGANHTRLQHSIGVAMILDRLICNTILSHKINVTKNKFKQIVSLNSPFTAVRKFVRLGGILHDIGHGPLSHTSEELLAHVRPDLIKNSDEKKKLKPHEMHTKEIIGNADKKNLDKLIFKCLSFDPGSSTASPESLLRALGKFSVGNFEYDDSEALKATNNYGEYHDLRWLNSAINGPYDADRLDYHMRDPVFAGVGYQATDFSRFLRLSSQKNTIQKKTEEDDYKNGFGVGPAMAIEIDRGLGTLEAIDIQRAVMYPNVYLHSTGRAIDAMINRAFFVAASHKNKNRKQDKLSYFFYGERDQWPTFYNSNDFNFLWTLNSYLNLNKREIGNLYDIIQQVITRNIFKKIRVKEGFNANKDGRPLYIRLEEMSSKVISKIEEIGKSENSFHETFLFSIYLEQMLEEFINTGNITTENGNNKINKISNIIIDIPLLPKKTEIVGLIGRSRDGKQTNLNDKLKTRNAAYEISKREWFIAIYANTTILRKIANEKYNSRFKMWLENFLLKGGDGLSGNIKIPKSTSIRD